MDMSTSNSFLHKKEMLLNRQTILVKYEQEINNKLNDIYNLASVLKDISDNN